MADWYPQEEGAVFDANSYILPCYPDGAISEMSGVKMGTTVAGRISVIVSAVQGDAVGLALKAATGAGAPTRIPILFYGVAKCNLSGTAATITSGTLVWNSVTTTIGPMTAWAAFASLVIGGGTLRPLGMALQGFATTGDDGLILVGKVM